MTGSLPSNSEWRDARARGWGVMLQVLLDRGTRWRGRRADNAVTEADLLAGYETEKSPRKSGVVLDGQSSTG